MTAFEIIMVSIAFLTLCAGIVTSYTKTMIEIAKIQVQVRNLEHEMMQKEHAILKLEARNSLEHDRIMERLNLIIDKNGK